MNTAVVTGSIKDFNEIKIKKYSCIYFKKYEKFAIDLGFKHVESGPLVRSSYKAQKHIN
mgnify:CR=1 FL=1